MGSVTFFGNWTRDVLGSKAMVGNMSRGSVGCGLLGTFRRPLGPSRPPRGPAGLPWGPRGRPGPRWPPWGHSRPSRTPGFLQAPLACPGHLQGLCPPAASWCPSAIHGPPWAPHHPPVNLLWPSRSLLYNPHIYIYAQLHIQTQKHVYANIETSTAMYNHVNTRNRSM